MCDITLVIRILSPGRVPLSPFPSSAHDPRPQMAVSGELSHTNIVTTFQCRIRPLLQPPPASALRPTGSSPSPGGSRGPGSRLNAIYGGVRNGSDLDASMDGGGEAAVSAASLMFLPSLMAMAEERECIDPFTSGKGSLQGRKGGLPLVAAAGVGSQGQPCELRLIMELCDGEWVSRGPDAGLRAALPSCERPHDHLPIHATA